MALFSFKSKKNDDIKNAREASINQNNIKQFLLKVVGLSASPNGNRGEFSSAEYDFEEIKTAYESDSYLKASKEKYTILFFKAGYKLKSDNEAALTYVKQRFNAMSFSTGKPMDILLQEVADDLFQYSNAFLLKARADKLLPGIKAKAVLSNKVVGGYFRVAPETMQIKRDSGGKVIKYMQEVEGETKEFKPEDVVHIYMDKNANNAFGTPRCIAALEDIKILRRLEGNVLNIVYRFASPLLQWKIGKTEKGFQATSPEIDDARKEIENSALDGVVVTNEKVEIKVIGSEGNVLDVSKYLDYFERRVFSALCVSASQMGRNDASQNADSMEEQAHNIVKYIQRTMSVFIEYGIINEILLEGGYDPIINEKDMVKMCYEEINTDTKIKLENHEMLKFQSNIIAFEEMRTNLGMTMKVDEDRLYKNMIEVPATIKEIDAKTESAKEISKHNSSTGIKPNGNGQTKSQSPNDDMNTRNRPENQNGTYSAKIKESKESYDYKKTSNNVESIYKEFDILKDDLLNGCDKDIVLSAASNTIKSRLTKEIINISQKGINTAKKDIEKINKLPKDINININTGNIVSIIDEHVDDLFKDIRKNLNNHDIESTFASFGYRLKFIINYVLPKSYWFSYVKTCKSAGIKKVYVHFNNSEDSKKYESTIDTENFDIDSIPAFHSHCDCEIKLRKE